MVEELSEIRADVVVVGAGTAGSYFAWRMVEKGFDIVVVEKKKLGSLGEHIDIFHIFQRLSSKLRKLYENYPTTPPKKNDEWILKVDPVWAESKNWDESWDDEQF